MFYITDSQISDVDKLINELLQLKKKINKLQDISKKIIKNSVNK